MMELRRVLAKLGADEDTADHVVRAFEQGDRSPLLRFLFLHSMWSNIISEERGSESGLPKWIEVWRRLGENGSPFIHAAALARMVEAGDNLANQIDDAWGVLKDILPRELAEEIGWSLCESHPVTEESGAALGGLHEDFGSQDPTGREGAPRSLVERRFRALPEDVRRELWAAEGSTRAALIWRRETGDDLAASRAAVETLRRLSWLRPE